QCVSPHDSVPESGLGWRTSKSLPSGSGNHQFQRPKRRISDGTSSARIRVASMMIPAASPIANCLTSGPGLGESEKNASISTRAALVTSLPVREPELDRLAGVSELVVGLAHAREHEHLVVHREPVEEGEDHQRNPGDDRVARLQAPDRIAAVALLED